MWVEQRKNGNFRYGERYKDPYTGKYSKTFTTLSSNSKQAQKKAQTILNEQINEILNERTVTDVPFHIAKDEWYTSYIKSLRPSSIAVTNSALKIITNNIDKDVLINRIDARFTQKILDGLNYSDDYLSHIKSILNKIFEYAEDKGMVKESPMPNVKLVKKAKTIEDIVRVEDKYLEVDEAEALIQELYRNNRTYRLARLAEFIYLTGARIGEAVILTPHDINNEIVHITGTIDYTEGYKKGKKGPTKTPKGYRDIQVTNRTVELINRTIQENKLDAVTSSKYVERGFIFVTKSGTPIQTNSFNLALKKAADRIGIKKASMSSHIFRHTHVSVLAENNIQLKAIMDRIGHDDEATTNEIYTHVTKKMKFDIIDKLEKLGL